MFFICIQVILCLKNFFITLTVVVLPSSPPGFGHSRVSLFINHRICLFKLKHSQNPRFIDQYFVNNLGSGSSRRNSSFRCVTTEVGEGGFLNPRCGHTRGSLSWTSGTWVDTRNFVKVLGWGQVEREPDLRHDEYPDHLRCWYTPGPSSERLIIGLTSEPYLCLGQK